MFSDLIYPPKVTRPVRINEDRTLSPDNHTKLVRHLYHLLARDWENVEERRAHFSAVEADLLGIVEPLGDDCDTKANRANTKGAKVPDAIYPFGYLTLQKFASELMSVVMPVEAPYAVVTTADQQQKANALVKAFRHQSVIFDHRNNVQSAVFDALALDCFAVEMKWSKLGRMDQAAPAMNPEIPAQNDVAGLKIIHLDPYNIAWDPRCHTSDVAAEGEFFAHFEASTPFRLRREKLRGLCFLDDDIIAKLERQCGAAYFEDDKYAKLDALDPAFVNRFGGFFYYEPKIAKARSTLHDKYGTRTSKAETNFTGLFSPIWAEFAERGMQDAVHVTKFYVRIKPHEWGLTGNLTGEAARRAPFEIWEIHLVGQGYISFARRVIQEIDRMPIAVGSMNFHRKFGRSMKFGDHAAQMGLLASTVLNMYKRAMRKGLNGGVTLYNADVVPLHKVSDMDNGKVAVRQLRFDDDLRKHVMQLSDVPDYKNTVNDANNLIGMLERMFPTNSQPAVAGLDRATTYQAQAVIMTGMRSLIFYATTLDGQLMVPIRVNLQHSNLVHADHLTYVDESTASLAELSRQDIQESGFHLIQSQPLIGVDRLRTSNDLRDMINVLFQSGGQLPPLAGLFMKHWMEMSGSLISTTDYEKAMQEQMQQDAEIRQAELARAGGGVEQQPQPQQ